MINQEEEGPKREPSPRRSLRRWFLGCGLLMALLVCTAGAFLARSGLDLQEWTRFLPGVARSTPPPLTPEATEPSQSDGQGPQEDVAGRIAFISASGQIGTVAADGSQRRQLTDEEGKIYLFPAWSPGGDQIAAISSGRDGAGVYAVSDEPDGEASELYFDEDDAPIYLYWARDGERVSFIASYESDLGLFLAAADGEGESRLLATGQPLYWDWVGQEERLLVHTGTPQSGATVTFVDVAEAQSSGDEVSAPGYFQAPVVSADGAYIGFAEIDANEERWVVARDLLSGSTTRARHAGVAAMGWSPTDDLLAYISADGPRRGSQIDFYGPLRLLEAATGDVQTLVDERVLAFFWSPDGRKIAYLTVAEGEGEQVAEVARAGRWRQMSRRARQHEELRLSLWLVDVLERRSAHLLDFRPTEVFVRQFLPFFDQYALSHRVWSPDSKALALPVREGEEGRIYVVNADGQGIQTVAEGVIAFWSNR